MIEYNPVQTTPFTKYEKILARIWRLVWIFFYRPTPWFFYKFRVLLLNIFGANVSYKSKPANSSFVEFPWNLTMKDYSSIGEWSWIYALDAIYIDEFSCIGQGCRLITASHDYKSLNFEMRRSPISIGKGCWLTSYVTVLMGVEIGDFSVVGTNSLVDKNISSNKVAVGSPARVIRERFHG